MFDKNNDHRLQAWSEFRKSLETSNNPIQDVLDFYSQSPIVSIHTDPWDETVWPTPWELVQENQYCEFCIVLGMCYSLQLTDRFSGSNFEIHIVIDKKNSMFNYLLYIDKSLISYPIGERNYAKLPPDQFEVKKKYSMPKLQ